MADDNSHDIYGSAGSSSDHTRVALFPPISTPALRSAHPAQVAKFFKDRVRYELEITTRQAEVPTLHATP